MYDGGGVVTNRFRPPMSNGKPKGHRASANSVKATHDRAAAARRPDDGTKINTGRW